jgi:hypothetical protein
MGTDKRGKIVIACMTPAAEAFPFHLPSAIE